MTELNQDTELESQLLGSMLTSEDALIELSQLLKPVHFLSQENRVVYESIMTLFSANKPVNIITVAEQVKKHKTKVSKMYVMGLTNKYVPPSKMDHYAKVVIEQYMRRETISFIPRIGSKASDSTKDIFDILDETDKFVSAIRDSGSTEVDIRVSVALDEADKRYQKAVVSKGFTGYKTGITTLDEMIGGFEQGDSIVIGARPSMAKCLGKDTPILMFDGSIKMVQDVVVGDVIMGNDSTPRTVLSLARGREEMFEIIPNKGEKWICNRSHILSLRMSTNNGSVYQKGQIINMSVDEYLKKNIKFKHHAKQYSVPVDLPSVKTTVDPYLYGLWLGDGHFTGPRITNCDFEVHDYLKKYRPSFRYDKRNNVPCITLTQNPLLRNLIKKATSTGQKRITKDYLVNSRESRLRLLAGILDTDGYYCQGMFEITTKYSGLRDDILFLCRSLGFRVTYSYKKATIKSLNFVGYYWKLIISGDLHLIPCKVKRRQASKSTSNRDVLNVGFSVKSIGEGDYYGFEIDGNRLFVMGNFVVTHNTATMLSIAKHNSVQNKVPVCIFSHEMRAWRLINRMICDIGQLDMNKLKFGQFNEDELARYDYTKELIAKAPLYIDDTPGLTTQEIKLRAKRYKRKYGIEMFMDDYIQRRTGASDKIREVIMEASRTNKTIAQENKAVFVELSQIDRRADRSDNKEPNISDLAESSAIESDADIIMFPHRPSYYGIEQDEEGRDMRNRIKFLVKKNREGNTGECWAYWYGNTQSIKNEDRNATQFPAVDPNHPFANYQYKHSIDNLHLVLFERHILW